jgi:thiol-disulfide isomerase/thioredoxin
MVKDLVSWLSISLIIFFISGCNQETREKGKSQAMDVKQQVEIQENDLKEKLPQEKEIVSKEKIPQEKGAISEENMVQEKPIEVDIRIEWYASFTEGLNIAKEKKKPLMVDFDAGWCIWCKKLDETTYKDEQVIALSKEFIPVKVDCDEDTITPGRYGIRGLPTILFLNPGGQVIHQVIGYRSPENLLLEMKKALK